MANSVAVKFKEAIFTDMVHPQQLEDAIRRCGAFSGIHDYDVDDAIDEGFAGDLSDWTCDTTGGTTWTITPPLTVVGGGGAIWYEGIHDTEVPASMMATFDLVSGAGAFVFRAKDGANDCYIAFWTASACGFAVVADAKTSTTLTSMPFGISGPATIQVVVTWRFDAGDENRKWLQMAMFADGLEMVAYADDIGGTAYDWTGDGIGFAVTGANTLVVDDLLVSEFSRQIDYVSIDPGEHAGQGVGRAIGTTRIITAARYDGTMRVAKPGNRDSDYTIDPDNALRFMPRYDYRDVITHIRTIGAFHAVDHFEDDDGDAYMHRFSQADNPNLMSEEEVYREATAQLGEAQEERQSYQISLPLAPFLERHDRVTLSGVDYRVLSVNHVVQQTERGPTLTTVLEVRRYIAV